MRSRRKRARRLGDALKRPRSQPSLDLTAFFVGLEYGPEGEKVSIIEEPVTIELEDGSPYTYLKRTKEIVSRRRADDGSYRETVVRLPVRMDDINEWTRIHRAIAHQQKRDRAQADENMESVESVDNDSS